MTALRSAADVARQRAVELPDPEDVAAMAALRKGMAECKKYWSHRVSGTRVSRGDVALYPAPVRFAENSPCRAYMEGDGWINPRVVATRAGADIGRPYCIHRDRLTGDYFVIQVQLPQPVENVVARKRKEIE